MTEQDTAYTRRAQELLDRARGWTSAWHRFSDGDDYPQWSGWLFSSLSVASLGEDVEYFCLTTEKLDGPSHALGRIVVLTPSRVLSIDVDTNGVAQRTEFEVVVRPRSAIRSVALTSRQNCFARDSFNGRPNGHPVGVTLQFDDGVVPLEFVAGTVFSHQKSEDSLERLLSSLR